MPISITYDYNSAMADMIGGRHGLTESMLRDLEARARVVDSEIRALRQRGEIGFYDLADAKGRARELDEILAVGQTIAKRFANFVVLGIGGSALGPICVQRALGHLYHNLLDKPARGNAPRIFVLDNIDPELLADTLDVVDPAETCFNVITKSGDTPETMAQFMAFYDRVVARVGEGHASKHFVVTTSQDRGTLRPVADKLGMRCLWIPNNVGGRFSELSAVGLLPAAVAGIDIHAMIAGAQAVARACDSPGLFDNPAYLNGAVHFLAERFRGKTISVMMPYCEALRDVADWYRQLWAESLGKRRGQSPHEVCVGQTPVRALGTTDQHSQIQLYVDGPNDKIITLLDVKQFRREFPVGTRLNERMPELAYLAGRDISDLFRAEMDGTEFALARAERPSVRITLQRMDAEHIGGLLFFFMVQTAFAGGLYGINAFDQPGVEMGKQAAAALMGRGKKPQDGEMMSQIEAYRSKRDHYSPLRIEMEG
jgi:glucose-6-phosphate isomerase